MKLRESSEREPYVASNQIFRLLVILVFLSAFTAGSAVGQNTKQLASHKCIELRVVSQEYYPPSKVKSAPDYIDLTPDDILAKFRVTNSCSGSIFYLSSTTSKSLVGFMLYNREGKGWSAFSPAWGREGPAFGGVTSSWIEMRPGQQVDFEASHLSTVPGKRSFAAYFNSKPADEGQFEVDAEEYCAPILVYKNKPRHN